MKMLRLGSNGNDVSHLQTALRQYEPQLSTDGIFGPRTERAVRVAQRRNGLYPPDGIVGPITMGALGMAGLSSATPTRSVPIPAQRSAAFRAASAASISPATPLNLGKGDPGPLKKAIEPARQRAKTNVAPAGVAKPVALLATSRAGRRFIIGHEALRGVSNHLHHPSAGSGVTIGPGYDMKDRSASDIEHDLIAVNVARAAASQASKGAGLSGASAGKFAKDNRQLIDLDTNQEVALLDQIIGHYEAMVKRAIKMSLHQYEFDALVSYAYNPGGGWRKTTALVNAGKPHDAMVEIKRHITSKGEVIRSLIVRREAESRMFLYGEYR